ncbi:hypothetical protein HRbin02_00895 [Candidatus Calditenuaceae archaeon HR02]|nr:hypothetical protein HRbin02_00895 [Candidatus Calditenuaceae archaeon HR02]
MMSRPVERLFFTLDTPSCPLHEIDGVVRGLVPVLDGLALIGEGMGLGGVVGILGRRTLFPLTAETHQFSSGFISREIQLNGVSLKYLSKACVDKPYRKLKTLLSPLYLQSKVFRPLYIMLMAGRTLIRVKSRYIRLKKYGAVHMMYRINGSEVEVTARRETPKSMRILVANELSGRLFTHLMIDGVKKFLPPWMKLENRDVELVSPSLKLSMIIDRPDDVKSFAGREVLGNRLDWAGISLEFPEEEDILHYRLVFKELE